MKMYDRLSITTILCRLGVCAFASCYGVNAWAAPQDGNVAAGKAAITQNGKKTDIHQSSQRAVIDWRTFNIAPDEHTQFHQPNGSSVTLNRVGGDSASHIAGKLTANGHVVIVNPNGVLFGSTAQVDVNGLVASTSDISNQDFMKGDMRFTIPGKPDAAVVNQGHITARDAGLVGLVAPNVLNNGVIEAKMGRVQLASGDAATIDLYGDGLMEVRVSDAVQSQLVVNQGRINADGGTIALTAAAGAEIVNSLIFAGGEMKAASVGNKQGKIHIYAEGSNAVKGNDSAQKGQKTGLSTVLVQAHLDVSGRNAGEQGGTLEVLGDNIALLGGTVMDARGHSAPSTTQGAGGTATMTADNNVRKEAEFLAHANRAGGSVKIGGDYLGTGDTPTAKTLVVEANTLVLNDAMHIGDAGRTIFWSDGDTKFEGLVLARGGAEWGNGGFVETSGKNYLNATGFVDLSATNGQKGTYLLDPANITIYGNFAPDYQSTDGSIDLAPNLYMWFDASDADAVILSYTDEGWGMTADGVAGDNTITISNGAHAWQLIPGSRIRLGGAGADAAASTMGDDTYTIVAVNGTQVTLAENLTTNYSGADFYRSRVAIWNNKAGGDNAFQNAVAARPHFISGGQGVTGGTNGLNTITSGAGEFFSSDSGLPMTIGSLFTAFNLQTSGVGAQGIISTGNNPTETNPFLLLQENNGTLRYLNNGAIDGYEDIGTVSTGVNYLFSQVTYNTARALYVSANEVYNEATGLIPNSGFNDQTFLFSGWNGSLRGSLHEVISYDLNLDDTSRQLIEQYQAAKWGVDLLPPGTGATEVARATAADGYSAFTTRYLERLSETSNVILHADNNITLDLKGDTLRIDNDRSLTLRADNGDITTVSNGGITTHHATTQGNLTLDAGGDIHFNHSFVIDAQNGGVVTFNANDVNFNNNLSLYADHVVVNGASRGILTWRTDGAAPTATFAAGTGTLIFEQSNGGRSLGLGGGVADTVLSAASINQIKNGFDSYTFGKADGGDIFHHIASWDAPVTFRTGGDFVQAAATTSTGAFRVEAGGDIRLQQGITSNAAGLSALVLSAEGNFLNSAGANALQAPNGRWLVYSTDPMDNQRGGVMPTAVEFGKTFATDAPATIAAGNRLIYATTVQPTVHYVPANMTITEGNPFTGGTLHYVSGLAAGDTTGNIGLSGSPVFASTYNTGDPVGTYAITASAGTLYSLLGYQFAFNPGVLTVQAADGGGGGTPPQQPSGLPGALEYQMQRPMDEKKDITQVSISQAGKMYANGILLTIDPRVKEEFALSDDEPL